MNNQENVSESVVRVKGSALYDPTLGDGTPRMNHEEEDMDTVSHAMELFLFLSKTQYNIIGVVIDDIVTDIIFKYEILDGLQIIDMTIVNDKILDSYCECIPLFNMKLSYKHNIHSNKKLCRLALESMLDIIPTLSFDAFIGRFLPPVSLHRQNSKLHDATKNIFLKIGIKLIDNSQSCIVCYENTNCITKCNHALCYICCSRIVETNMADDDEDDDNEELRCPVCRAVCLYP